MYSQMPGQVLEGGVVSEYLRRPQQSTVSVSIYLIQCSVWVLGGLGGLGHRGIDWCWLAAQEGKIGTRFLQAVRALAYRKSYGGKAVGMTEGGLRLRRRRQRFKEQSISQVTGQSYSNIARHGFWGLSKQTAPEENELREGREGKPVLKGSSSTSSTEVVFSWERADATKTRKGCTLAVSRAADKIRYGEASICRGGRPAADRKCRQPAARNPANIGQ